jgi:hypothetical protein
MPDSCFFHYGFPTKLWNHIPSSRDLKELQPHFSQKFKALQTLCNSSANWEAFVMFCIHTVHVECKPYSSLQKQIKKGSIMFCICNLTYGWLTRVETVAFRLAEWKDLIAPSSLFLYLYLSISLCLSVDIRFGEIIWSLSCV